MQNNNYNNQHAQFPTNNQYPGHLHAHTNNMYNNCVVYMKRRVKIVTVDQQIYKGTIDNVDNIHVYLILDDASNENPNHHENNMQFDYGNSDYRYGSGYGYGAGPGYGYGPGYGGGTGFGGGLAGALLPLVGIAAISALR